MTLVPYPLAALVGRLFRELRARRSVFDLPVRRMVLDGGAHDLSVRVHGQRASTPFGPAAGPHTQLAQNILLSWLAGGRILELKTVQVRDDLVIPRPCIDMETVGFNVEWSQELRLEESLEEYAKAALLIRLVEESGALPVAPGFGSTVLDLSVGYDLAGLKSPRVEAFLRGAADIGPIVDRLRRDVPAEQGHLRDVDVPPALSRSVTLSTFHGCPPDEIEAMARHLMRAHALHTVVKLNPTLLGPRDARHLLNDVLGYHELRVPERAFTEDTSWTQMVDMVGRLREEARALGLGFGIKLTNTLIVENHRSFFPASESQMYLSGPPLHVLSIELLRRVRRALGPEVPVSFSAGVDAGNFADVVALDLVPVTVCTDLLKPGGYARAFAYFQRLRERMKAVGASCLGDFVIAASGRARDALDRLDVDDGTRARATTALETLSQHGGGGAGGPWTGPPDDGSPLKAAVGEELYARWRQQAGVLNVEAYADRVVADARYAAAANRKPPRKIGRRLQLFDCLTCDKCIPVCPNDAIFTFTLPLGDWPRVTLVREGSRWVRRDEGTWAIAEKHQIAIFADFCNECGNCDVFCPEDGGPYLLKPEFYGSADRWERARPRDGFFVAREDGQETVLARIQGREFRLDLDASRARFRGEGFDVRFAEDDPEGTIQGDAADGAVVELVYFLVMRALVRTVCAPEAVNYVSALASPALKGRRSEEPTDLAPDRRRSDARTGEATADHGLEGADA